MKTLDDAKRNGVHYTPNELADFLARSIIETGVDFKHGVSVLDPACGDGGLLAAFTDATPQRYRKNLSLYGYDRDPNAIQGAQERLATMGLGQLQLHAADFLDVPGVGGDPLSENGSLPDAFDVVISNPPYVRTQVLGAAQSQALAARFGITGRVDLYHAFTIAMTRVLRDSGHLGLLTSNRFLSVRSGRTMRDFLRRHYELRRVVDLGDTRLFAAAVLPVIIAGIKRSAAAASTGDDEFNDNALDKVNVYDECDFLRVYQARNVTDSEKFIASSFTVLETLRDTELQGNVTTTEGDYAIQRGKLRLQGEEHTWAITTAESKYWLRQVTKHEHTTFGDIAEVRVGVKTTADKVFIREDWSALDPTITPEPALIHPLLTHHDAVPWATTTPTTKKSILYPYCLADHRRTTIRLDDFPRAQRYFQEHEQRLKSRKYLIDGGRDWFEIWVPHTPNDWRKRKIVFPDISEQPTFFLDEQARIVNGDCYWMTLKDDVAEDYLYLILAVANSDFACRFYDTQFCNKLYAGRRRFMTQYVKQFPLPDLESEISQRIIAEVKGMVAAAKSRSPNCNETTKRINGWVDEAFGVSVR